MKRALAQPTLAHAFRHAARCHGDQPALRDYGSDGVVTYRQWLDRSGALAAGLHGLGVRAGDRVALLMGTRSEFHLIDVAALLLGAVPFSLYTASPPAALRPCVENAGPRVLIADAVRAAAARELVALCPQIERLVLIDPDPADAMSLAELERSGAPDFDVDAAIDEVRPEGLCTLVYTSGTTGPPKGVPFEHRGLMQTMAAIHGHVPFSRAGRTVSYLPMAHIAERMFSHYAGFVFGMEITSLADPAQLTSALREVRPTRFFGVPRTWEKVLAGVRRIEGGAPDADALDLPREVGLDAAEWLAVAGAPAGRDTLLALHAAGLPVAEMYGMSETIIATANPVDRIRVGTCGVALPGVELKLADDGEVLIGGVTVMRGYFRDPERTAEVLRDGWMHSGDIGHLDDDGYLTIVDRKKALIITDGGKNMSPATIEQALKGGRPLLAQVVALGDGRPYVGALVVLDRDGVETVRLSAGLPSASFAELTRHPVVRDAVEAAVTAGNADLARVEQVRRYVVLDHDWVPGGPELTPTAKVRRGYVLDRYHEEIEELYR